MSFRNSDYHYPSYSNNEPISNYVNGTSEHLLDELFLEIINNQLFGICFSMYAQGQKPGDHISADQIRRRLSILKPYIKWVRTFSCTESNELIPAIAKELGIKTLVGAWLGSDLEKNELEIENLISLTKQGLVDVAAVGNEVLYRKDLNEEQLTAYLRRVKQAIPNTPVGYVDAYYEFELRPILVDLSDILLINCYPFWEGTELNSALGHMNEMYNRVKNVSNGKPIMITETGWPSQGNSIGAAMPSHKNALKYFINSQLWASDQDIDMFYFSSFDEDWKYESEGAVGGFWGIMDINENLKFGKSNQS